MKYDLCLITEKLVDGKKTVQARMRFVAAFELLCQNQTHTQKKCIYKFDVSLCLSFMNWIYEWVLSNWVKTAVMEKKRQRQYKKKPERNTKFQQIEDQKSKKIGYKWRKVQFTNRFLGERFCCSSIYLAHSSVFPFFFSSIYPWHSFMCTKIGCFWKWKAKMKQVNGYRVKTSESLIDTKWLTDWQLDTNPVADIILSLSLSMSRCVAYFLFFF